MDDRYFRSRSLGFRYPDAYESWVLICSWGFAQSCGFRPTKRFHVFDTEVTWVRSDRLEENDVSPRRTRENGCHDYLTR